MDGHDSEDPKQSVMTIFVQNLQQMQTWFQTMSNSILSKIDEMGSHINELKQSINELKRRDGSGELSITCGPCYDKGRRVEQGRFGVSNIVQLPYLLSHDTSGFWESRSDSELRYLSWNI